jgi:hypothetical protein
MGKIRLSSFRNIEAKKPAANVETSEHIERAEPESLPEGSSLERDASEQVETVYPIIARTTKDENLPFIAKQQVRLRDGSEGRDLCTLHRDV